MHPQPDLKTLLVSSVVPRVAGPERTDPFVHPLSAGFHRTAPYVMSERTTLTWTTSHQRAHLCRPTHFRRHRGLNGSGGEKECTLSRTSRPLVSSIVPTVAGPGRTGILNRARASLPDGMG